MGVQLEELRSVAFKAYQETVDILWGYDCFIAEAIRNYDPSSDDGISRGTSRKENSMGEETACKTPLKDIRARALRDYEKGAAAIQSWSSFIENAIKNYNPEMEEKKDKYCPDCGKMMFRKEIAIGNEYSCNKCQKVYGVRFGSSVVF